MTMTRVGRLAIDIARSQQRQAGRANLRELAERNVGDKRARMAREGKARRAAALRRDTPAVAEPVRPSDVPVTFKATRPERRRVTRPATTTPVKAKPAPRVHTPIKAAELEQSTRDAAMRIVRSDGPDGWRLVAVWNRDSGRVSVYVRRHGASVRYSIAA
ncbi:hypothetical protein [Streptomyces sp. NPDC088775]|uniref:hypothetical protein n=1 Tax=Streptomyces sp. NPDC088775 TaxID=3365896 RepID=UPI0037F1C78F